MSLKEDVMKKLLIFMLVFGLASTANAIVIGDIELSFNGVINGSPDVTEYTVAPSDFFEIDVWGNLATTAYVNIHDGTSGFVPAPNVTIGAGVIYAAAGEDATIQAGPPAHAWVSAADLTGTPLDTVVAGKHFSWEIHCDEEGDVYIDLISLDRATVYDSIIVHQIPEPATIALLGLGSLFLMRRRRK